jgi:hypothetical protein
VSGTVLLLGIPSEPPLRMIAEALRRRGADFLLVSQRKFATIPFSYDLVDGEVRGTMQCDESTVDLSDVGGVYLRLMDDASLPEVRGAGAAARARCSAWHQALILWSEISRARVVNRLSAMASNGSKPLQLQIIRRHGLAVPETLISNDPIAILNFLREHGRLIYKSASGVRSIVQELTDADIARLDRVRSCPTQFQALVEGTNVRVHVVGTAVYATEIDCDVIDYRYANHAGGQAHLRATRLNAALEERCIRLASELGLAFAGIDLMLARDGCVYCFEVNPSPGFSFFEDHTGQPIADAVAAYLCQ